MFPQLFTSSRSASSRMTGSRPWISCLVLRWRHGKVWLSGRQGKRDNSGRQCAGLGWGLPRRYLLPQVPSSLSVTPPTTTTGCCVLIKAAVSDADADPGDLAVQYLTTSLWQSRFLLPECRCFSRCNNHYNALRCRSFVVL